MSEFPRAGNNDEVRDRAQWQVYIVRCDGRLYTGITTDAQRRLREHRAGRSRAARFTRSARTVELCYTVTVSSRSLALRAEHRIKRLPRARKLSIIESQPEAGQLLAELGIPP